ncbi:VWA domain-containing protein [Streptomyces sp. NPDC048718]|uniref:VWA domain-containing protein n=1 Tax=Streptomyces sp. NPDC048718 TaxID=3365587 RepID=UPI00371B3B79
MGIRSLLRKVFGRDRTTDTTPAALVPAQAESPEAETTTEAPTETGAEPKGTAAEPAAAPEATSVTETVTEAAKSTEPTETAEAAEAPASPEKSERLEQPEQPEATEQVTEKSAEAPVEPPVEEPAEEPTTAAPEPERRAEPESPAEPEASAEPVKPGVPAQSAAERAAADLVAASFDNPQIPRARQETPEPEPEPAAEAETETETTAAEASATEAATETTEQAAPAEEPEPEASTAAEPEPQASADVTEEPEATEPQAETEPAPEPQPQPQPQPESEPEPLAATEPEAAEPTEPEATEPEITEPQATEESASPAPEEPQARPAVSLARVKAAAPHLADAYKAAGTVLKKQGLTGARAAVYLVVDRSGSMRPYFKDGSVQRLAEQTVALAAHLSEDATATVVFFSTDIDGTAELRPADLTPTRVDELNATYGRMGRTTYHRAVEEVLALHEKSADPARPALVVFQTDGAPESKTAAAQALAEAAERPYEVHWRFTVWGEEETKAFDYHRKLAAPRTAVHFAGPAPAATAHTAFYRGLLADWSL